MGATQGKTKKEQKDEARQWAENKDNEIASIYSENAKLTNEMRLIQVDIQSMKRTIEQQQLIIEKMSKEKSPRRVHFEEPVQKVCGCPTTQEEYDAELQHMFDEEWELVLSSHAFLSAQARYMPGGKLDWEMLDDKGQQAVKVLQRHHGMVSGGQIAKVEEMRKWYDIQVKGSKELFKFEGNNFRSVAKVIFDLNRSALQNTMFFR